MMLSVVCVNWNTQGLLADCLTSIYHCAPRCPVEVVVVDNGSTDGSVEMVRREFPDAVLVRNGENIGFGRAVNQGIGVAKGTHVLLINSDATVLPGTLDALLACAHDISRVGIVGCRILNPDGTLQDADKGFPTLWSEVLTACGFGRRRVAGKGDAMEEECTRRCDWVSGACMLVTREAIDEVGALDERFFMYSEEVDWCYRMHAAGWQVLYCPRAVVVHAGGQSADRTSATQQMYLYRSKRLFLNLHRSRAHGYALICAVRLAAVAKVAYWWLRSVADSGRASAYRARAGAHWRVAQCRDL